jgi:GNAT superfamily N-acetyltransferase
MGFVEYFTRESELVVTGLWVRPDERRNGYGTMILELVEVYENPMIMRVIAEPRSEKFYQKVGYESDFGMRILAKVRND